MRGKAEDHRLKSPLHGPAAAQGPGQDQRPPDEHELPRRGMQIVHPAHDEQRHARKERGQQCEKAALCGVETEPQGQKSGKSQPPDRQGQLAQTVENGPVVLQKKEQAAKERRRAQPEEQPGQPDVQRGMQHMQHPLPVALRGEDALSGQSAQRVQAGRTPQRAFGRQGLSHCP